MADPTGATREKSPSSNNGGDPTRTGDSGAKTTEQLLAEHKAENERKASKISALEEMVEANNSRIVELEEKVKLTASDQTELRRLNRRNDDLESLIEEVESRPDSKGWLGAIDKRTAKAKEEAMETAEHNVFVRLQKEFLEEKAEEMGMKYDALVKEVRPFSSRYDDKTPLQKAKLALRDYLEYKKFTEEKAEIDKKKKEAEGFLEKDGNKARETSLEEIKSKGDKMAEMKVLGL